ncbi:MAG: helix-turn-helix transcriptional regulator [Microbacteriaceae bacterium]|nr:helix-turn-helix transcriptional regulator [Microbacteriaceae bacterium]
MVRSDARENRARILAAAREALAADGSTSMNQIGQRAGVGAGTLYRNFPTRDDLLLAVYEAEVERIVAAVPSLLDLHAPLEALRRWTLDLVAAMRAKHGLGDALGSVAHQAANDRSHGPVIQAISTIFEAGKADGSIRRDADPGDFLQFTSALWRAASAPDDRAPGMLDLLLDGLRAR